MRQEGRLSEKIMDEDEIPSVEDQTNSVPRDQRPIQNNRALLVTHPATVSVNTAHADAQAARKDPDVVASHRQEKKDRRFIERVEQKEEKKRLAAEAKVAELLRRSQLTKDELKAEKEQRKVASKARKRETDEQEKVAAVRRRIADSANSA